MAWSISPLTQESGPTSNSARAVIAADPVLPLYPILKPDTEPFSSLASSASWPIDTAVRLVPSVVCCVILRMSCMLVATSFADLACCSVVVVMPSISRASCCDTVPISASAWPAASDKRAPSTTPWVLFSMAVTARSEEHTSELQSPCNLVCRLLLEKKKKINKKNNPVQKKKTQHENT